MARILIIGAGVVGLSVARSALLAGHDVLLLEQGACPNPQAASYDNHRMIRYPYGAAVGYTRMVTEAFAAWDRLWADLGETHFENTGAIAISLEKGDYAEKTRDSFLEVGVPHDVLDRAGVERLCPHLNLPAEAWGVVAFPGGPLFANRIVEGLAGWLRARNVTIEEGAKATSLDEAQGIVTLADGSTRSGDAIVIAAGAWLPRLMPERYAALPVYRQALVYVEPPAQFVQSWREAPSIAVIGDRTGYTLPDLRGAGLKIGYSAHRRPASPDAAGFGSDFPVESSAVLTPFKPYFRDFDAYRPLRMQVGYYVMDPSRRFQIRRSARAVVVTNCDGQMFKFGPLMGERIVEMIDGRLTADSLESWAAGY